MPRILFVKTSSLGDLVHNFPAVSDAARAAPGADIDWVAEESFMPLVAMHPAVRRVIPVALRRWRAAPWHPDAWAQMRRFREALREHAYDAVIDTQSLLKSALVTALARGRRHGLDRASAREPLAALFYEVRHGVPRSLHAVERNRLLVAAALGCPARGEADYGLRMTGPRDGPAVLLTMTSRADKLWPEASWIELARALAAPVILPWGSEAERGRAERIAAALPEARVPARLSIEGLGALLAAARAVVGLDTGLTHLAAALGARTVGIYCGSDPALTGLYGMANGRNVGGRGRPPSVEQVLAGLA